MPLPQNVIATIKSSLAKEITTTQEIYYNIQSLKAIASPIDESTKSKVVKNLEKILKKDDSLNSLGNGFFVAAEMGQDAKFAYDRIEDAIVQADEVDGRMLQFEGGLSVTSLIVNGALKLSSMLSKPVPINEDQAMKLATYFLSRRSVQSAKGASVLLESLRAISSLSIAPISIEVIGNGQIAPETEKFNVRLCNFLGEPLSPAIAIVQATITSKSSGVALTTKSNLIMSTSDKSVYSLDIKQFQPTRGMYLVNISAGSYQQKLPIKVIGKVKVGSLEIGVGDSDSSSQFKKQSVTFPSKLGTVLNADAQQKVVVKAVLLDEASDKPITVHQSFVRLSSQESGEEIIFVAEQDTSKAYKFDMDVGARGGDFSYMSGVYSIEFIVGDSSISNSFRWHLADIQLKFTSQDFSTKREDTLRSRAALPEIEHKFREPESRPPRLVSDLFSLLCWAPLAILFGLWMKMRVNISNFSFSLSALGFHVGFGAILALFGVFWWKLDMFQTIRYLMPIAGFTFLCGNRLLRAINASRTKGEKYIEK